MGIWEAPRIAASGMMCVHEWALCGLKKKKKKKKFEAATPTFDHVITNMHAYKFNLILCVVYCVRFASIGWASSRTSQVTANTTEVLPVIDAID